ncbi:hypothetical protein [Mesorhizobium sp.]|uniref:hypothetical protein n=1 Tax=Mesorhizobium sp. TaxID=1871066 RepID=UPI0025804DB7|nr:hypothetical protein [Mesorhizobium sp.]
MKKGDKALVGNSAYRHYLRRTNDLEPGNDRLPVGTVLLGLGIVAADDVCSAAYRLQFLDH